MLKKALSLIAGAAIALTMTTAAAAFPVPAASIGVQEAAPAPAQNESRRERRERERRANTSRNPDQLREAAEVIGRTTNTTCTVQKAVLRGVSDEKQSIYEAECREGGPGYIFIDSTPAQALSCVELAGIAELTLYKDPAAVVGLQCTAPANQGGLEGLKAYATEAAVPCTVDSVVLTGKVSSGNTIYEAGCAGADGYWINKDAAGAWKLTPCIELVSRNEVCRLTTAEEQAATMKGWLVGSEAATCDVTQGRFMGGNANGVFYEFKCAAGDGVITRMNAEKAVQQVYPCATAQRIGGGCTLTPAPAAPAAAPAPAPAGEE